MDTFVLSTSIEVSIDHIIVVGLYSRTLFSSMIGV